MAREEKLVAVISPWTPKLGSLTWKTFRLESLPTQKKVMAWRHDLQTEGKLRGELKKLGFEEVEIRIATVTA
jgi:hypothetical protein